MTIVKKDGRGHQVVLKTGPRGWCKCFWDRSLVGRWLAPGAPTKARHEFEQWLDDDELAEHGKAMLEMLDAAVREAEDLEHKARL